MLSQKSKVSIPAYENIFVYKDGSINKIRVIDGSILDTFELPNEMRPLSFIVNESFKVSISQNYVVWFVPTQGLIRLKLSNRTVEAVYKPSEWFLENPYFQFYGDSNTLVLIDSDGSEMKWINFDSGIIETRPVPFPFGTVFTISPDLSKIFFIEGYRQSKATPIYLITDIHGNLITKFSTNSEIADRNQLVWASDSKSLMTVENGNQIISYTLDVPQIISVLYEVSKDEKILSLDNRGELLLFRTNLYLYLYDQQLQTLIKKLPVDSLIPLNAPRVVLVDRDYYYIEEEVKSFEYFHKRLWHGDWTGGRRLIVPDYGHHVIQNDSIHENSI
jgi:hypothetical protein